ncbi:MAG TPA: PAS domain S-box protein [Leptospiraceae bacterium]|nr:PAS domain S-box protein [Leptospiraceae bacterium]HMW05476.1 PAS domain S-box protein [Leptospiraceae bacterium]HMX33217.1 PAS domain S-box protein [Leptospiraceae bacterium]HMY30986.1 PAS domain S-box protein [Leptospiraceae bacterium]HMZ64400.1 PAS domain S-box protein [Leptospiraceae bacterium]
MTSRNKKQTVLLVEDETIIALMETRQLEKEGYSVIHVETGEAAIDLVNENRDQVDIILMDIDLGSGIDGTQTAKEILKTFDIPIVFLSARVEKEFVQKTEAITSYGYVVKNSGINVIDASIKMAFKLYEARKETEKQKKRITAIIQSIGDAVIATDHFGNIIQMNAVAENLTGWNFVEAEGRELHEVFQIIDPKTRKIVTNPVELVLSSQKSVTLAEHKILIGRNGREYKISDSGAPIRDGDENITGVVLVFKDITKEYEAQRRIEISENSLQEAQRIAKLGSWQINLKTREVHCSKQFYSIFEVSEDINQEEIIQKIRESIHLKNSDLFTNSENFLINKNYFFDHKIHFPNNKIKYINTRIEPVLDESSIQIAYRGIVQDMTDRMNIEIALKQSEAHLRAIVDATPSCIKLVDRDGTLVNINSVGLSMIDVKNAKDVIGKNVYQLIHPDHRETFKKFNESICDGKKGSLQFKIITAKGRIKWFETNAVPLQLQSTNTTIQLAITQDITEEKKFEQALLESEELYHSMFEKTQAIKLIIDPTDGTIVDANSAAVEFYGYSIDQFKHLKISNINTLPEEMIQEELRNAAKEKRSYFNFKHRLANGAIRDVEVYSSPMTVNGRKLLYSVIHDITERKIAEMALIENERSMKILLDTMTEGIALNEIIYDQNGDMIDYKIVNVNKAFYSTVDYEGTEVIGNVASKLYKISPEFMREFWRNHKNQKTTIFSEIWSPVKHKYFFVATSPFVNGKFVTSFLDITERKNAEKALEEANIELEKLSNTDDLTKIGNRRYFQKTFDKECARARRNNHPLSIILIDIDDFKKYNDYFGHLKGDECLKTVATTISGLARRAADVTARWGGEEFIVLLPETNLTEAIIVAENIRKTIQSLQIPHPNARAANVVTLSLGIASWESEPPHEFIARADQALYHAKSNGRNRIEIAEELK